jgi:tRNA pseudouridine32 synthase/23S rRNA pseudouridine746 synthase
VEGKPEKFIQFIEDITEIKLPEKFTFPFYYQPHSLAKIAAKELQDYIKHHDFNHDFGTAEINENSTGKMFGVLVVQDNQNKLGYLAAFSGKIGDSNDHELFVPPVFDMLTENSYFLKEERIITKLNTSLHETLDQEEYQKLLSEKDSIVEIHKQQEEQVRKTISEGKRQRKEVRDSKKQELNESEYEKLKNQLAKESIESKLELKQLLRHQKYIRDEINDKLHPFEAKIDTIKKERVQRSNALQDRLFDSYQFLNQSGETKSLVPIFKHTALKKPPSGAGECAAPKLLQYAFQNNLKPLALAEFWWGAPPNTAVRKHGNFYPACLGKCEPILGHMLKGMELDENPLVSNLGKDKTIETVFEDDYILIINKPHDLLSVPGKEIEDSVYTRIKAKYKKATGPLIVHRLDMSTSGLMVLAKNPIAYKLLQRQFLDRSVKKTYTALLEGEVKNRKGRIELPLRLDIMDRPRQCVCFQHGKRARTDWRVDYIKNGRTRIILKPITGRTHQLRVHSAHTDGLNTPIVGDDLYGKVDKRLCLHATTLSFTHPKTNELISFSAPAPF